MRYDLEKDMIDVLDVFSTFSNTEATAKAKMSNHSRKLNGISLGKKQYSWDGKMRPRRVLSIRTMAMVLAGMQRSPEAQRTSAVILELVGDESPPVEPPGEAQADDAITSIVPYQQPASAVSANAVSAILHAAYFTGDRDLLSTVSRNLCKVGIDNVNAETELQTRCAALRHRQLDVEEE